MKSTEVLAMDICDKLGRELLICRTLEALVGAELGRCQPTVRQRTAAEWYEGQPVAVVSGEMARLEALRDQLHATLEELTEELATEGCAVEEAPAL